MASVRDIAKELGVSPATVSRAMNNHPRVAAAVRKKVLAAANRSRYVPHVARRSTTNIAFAYTGESSLGSPFDAALMQGMCERMDLVGLDLMIIDASRSKLPHESFTQMFLRKGIRGAVLRTTTRTRHVCEQIAAEGFPAVVVGDRFESEKVSFIYADSRGSSEEAVRHLVDLGHKRIAISVNVVDDSDHADRIAGWRAAMDAAGIEFDERLIQRSPAHREGGAQLIRKLMTIAPRPTAVYVTDPMAAVGAMNEAQRVGLKIPDDLSIVGFDDAQLRFQVHPQMTSVCQDATEIGREAFDALNAVIDQTATSAFVRRALPTHLEVYGSTAAPAVPPQAPVGTR